MIELKDLSDEELAKIAIDCIDDGAYNVYGESTPIHDLIRRYEALKAAVGGDLDGIMRKSI